MTKKFLSFIKKLSPASIITICTLIFSPAIFGFFANDDWYHLNISTISSVQEFFNFFSLSPTLQSTPLYRPISTQSLFYLSNLLFGLRPALFYLIVLILFYLNLTLVYHLIKKLTNKKLISTLAVIIYALSVSNFTRIYFISASQETTVAIFVLLTLITYLNRTKKQYLLSITLFIFALMSKENAIIIPGLLFLVDWYQNKINLKRIAPFAILTLLYLYFRIIPTLTLPGETFHLDFSPTRLVNTLFWYGLWQLGAPELLIDYIGSALRPIPRFFSDFPFFSYAIIALLSISTGLILKTLHIAHKKLNKTTLLGLGFLILGMLPMAFLPDHKFAFETAIPLIGFSLLLSQLIILSNSWGIYLLFSYIILNLSMNYLTYFHHYSVARAALSRRIYHYMAQNHTPCPANTDFYFIDPPSDLGPFGSYSSQVSYVISDSNMMQVVCGDKTVETFFNFRTSRPTTTKNVVTIPSEIFFSPL